MNKYDSSPLYQALAHTRARRNFALYGLPLFTRPARSWAPATVACAAWTYTYLHDLYLFLPYNIDDACEAISIIYKDKDFRDTVSTLCGLDPNWIENNVEDIALQLEKNGFKAPRITLVT